MNSKLQYRQHAITQDQPTTNHLYSMEYTLGDKVLLWGSALIYFVLLPVISFWR